MKCKYYLIVVLLLIAGNVRAEKLDNNKWYECIDRNECLEKKNAFSDLLVEYLRGDLPLNLSKLSAVGLNADELNLFKALKNIVLEDLDAAGGYLEMINDRDSVSRRVISAMISKDRNRVLELADDAPFLGLELAGSLFKEGNFTFAKKILDRLIKKYHNSSKVVVLWARSSIECGDFSSRIISRLKWSRKKDRFDLEVAATMIRYMSVKDNFKGIEAIKKEVGQSRGVGKAGYLLELARVEYKSGDLLEAEGYLQRALRIDPKNAENYLLLGKVYYAKCLKNVEGSYLNECREMPRAIASLKSYVALTENVIDAVGLDKLLALY